MEKTIYDLKLHEVMTILNGGANVMRVPGGWMYQLTTVGRPEGGGELVFVPYDEEFKPMPPVPNF